jgi:hypothetical protein
VVYFSLLFFNVKLKRETAKVALGMLSIFKFQITGHVIHHLKVLSMFCPTVA